MPWFPISESDSNSDSDISGKKVKEFKLLPSGSSKKEMTPRRLTKGPELLNTSTNHTATSCSPLNLQVIKTPTIVTSSSALAYHSSPGSSSYSLASPLGNAFKNLMQKDDFSRASYWKKVLKRSVCFDVQQKRMHL